MLFVITVTMDCTLYYIWYKTFFSALFLLLPKHLKAEHASLAAVHGLHASDVRGGEEKNVNGGKVFLSAVLGNGGAAWVSSPSQRADGVKPL